MIEKIESGDRLQVGCVCVWWCVCVCVCGGGGGGAGEGIGGWGRGGVQLNFIVCTMVPECLNYFASKKTEPLKIIS